MLGERTGGGGGQGFSALGGAIEGRRIRTFGVLAGVVSHREKKGCRGAAEGQIYFFRESSKGTKLKTGAATR
jgi:hypothetical protein